MLKTHLRLLTVALVAAAAVTVVARTQDLTAAWRQVDLTIDGNDREWPGGAALLANAPLAVGVSNDAEFLYLRVRTSDRGASSQLLLGGLTIWFDATGAGKKTFGIKYPVGAKPPEPGTGGRGPGRPDGTEGGMPPPSDRSGAERGREQGRGGPPQMDPAEIVPARLELLGGSKGDVRAFALDEAPGGIKAAISRVENALVLELRVPLVKSADSPDGIGAAPGAVIGLGLETGKIERPKMSGPGGMGGPGGGMGGRGGGMGGLGGGMGGPGGGMGGPGGPGIDQSSTVKAWTRVRLASGQ